jgi:hypothetical protein
MIYNPLWVWFVFAKKALAFFGPLEIENPAMLAG